MKSPGLGWERVRYVPPAMRSALVLGLLTLAAVSSAESDPPTSASDTASDAKKPKASHRRDKKVRGDIGGIFGATRGIDLMGDRGPAPANGGGVGFGLGGQHPPLRREAHIALRAGEQVGFADGGSNHHSQKLDSFVEWMRLDCDRAIEPSDLERSPEWSEELAIDKGGHVVHVRRLPVDEHHRLEGCVETELRARIFPHPSANSGKVTIEVRVAGAAPQK